MNRLGVGGINPASIEVYMWTRFSKVHADFRASKWRSIGKKSEAVITLFKWQNLIAAHYVAGIKAKNGKVKRFRFYNTFSDINGKKSQ